MSNLSHTQRTIRKHTLTSPALGEERGLIVYLPPGYNEIVSYPVIYCQDGAEFFNFGRIATQVNGLILEEGMEPVIIVGVEVDVKKRSDEYTPGGALFENYEKFFIEELLPWAESEYPIRAERSDRIIAGDSLGAVVSLELAMRYPELFGKVMSLSGAYYPSVRQRIADHASLSHLDVFMLIGLQEDNVELPHGVYDFLEMNRATRTLLQERNASVTYKERDGTHIWGFWQKELPEALLHFLSESR